MAAIVLWNDLPHGELGLDCRGVQIYWPLSRKLTLNFICKSIAFGMESKSTKGAAYLLSEPILRCERESVDLCNRLQTAQSSRFVYGPLNDFHVALEFLAAHPEYTELHSKIAPLEIGKVRKNPKMPPGECLVVEGYRTSHLIPLDSVHSERDQPMRVWVTQSGREALSRAMADGPFSLVRIFNDGNERRGMRDVNIKPDLITGLHLTITHRDPAVERITRSHSQ